MINLFVRHICRTVGIGAVVWGLSGILFACSGTDTTGLPLEQTTNPYALLQLNVRSAVMSTVAPYDTLQLRPVAYDVNGNVITLPGPVTYSVSDTNLSVSPTGLITLKATTASSSIVASVQDTSLKLTHTDTVFIVGVKTVPSAPLASFSIQPTGGDSAILDIKYGTKTLSVTAVDAASKGISTVSLALHFRSEDPSKAGINAKTGAVMGVWPGVVRLTASTTYFGVTKSDSLDFRIGYPDTVSEIMSATVLPGGTYQYNWSTSNLVIGMGKTVIFVIRDFVINFVNNLYYAGTSLPIGDRLINEGVSAVFDDSLAAQASPLPATVLAAQFAASGTGNVSIQVPDSLFVADSVVSTGLGRIGQYSVKLQKYCTTTPYPCATARAFPTPGTYHFTNPATGASGMITVLAP